MKWRARRYLTLLMATAGIAGGAGMVRAQLGGALPNLPQGGAPGLPIPGPLSSIGLPRAQDLLGPVDDLARRAAARLDGLRRQTFAQLVREHPDAITLDPQGFPARAGEVVVDAPSETLIAAATKAGYAIIERDDVLGVGFARLRVPQGVSLKRALDQLRKLGGEVSADQLHLASGGGVAMVAPPLAGQAAKADTMVGVIDGGVEGAAMLRGFASGAPRPNDHGTAVASLIAGGHGIRGALPGARIASADVYGTDPAGGNATAIAKALGWLVGARVPVVTISLVGPSNPLLARVVAAAQARGTIIVAAVGNNGAASPPAYPASYPGVIAVSGVDRRNRPLIEAGRAEHIDYVAPAADMLAAGVNGRRFAVRGTSFAAPLVAGRIAAVYPTPDPSQRRAALAKIDAEARGSGLRGPEKNIGRGMVCGDCRTDPQ